jgi:hypothetical protein
LILVYIGFKRSWMMHPIEKRKWYGVLSSCLGNIHGILLKVQIYWTLGLGCQVTPEDVSRIDGMMRRIGFQSIGNRYCRGYEGSDMRDAQIWIHRNTFYENRFVASHDRRPPWAIPRRKRRQSVSSNGHGHVVNKRITVYSIPSAGYGKPTP